MTRVCATTNRILTTPWIVEIATSMEARSGAIQVLAVERRHQAVGSAPDWPDLGDLAAHKGLLAGGIVPSLDLAAAQA